MIFSVLLSLVSVGFGVYKNIEAGNAKGFAYEQTYRVLNIVQQANISAFSRAKITDEALQALGTPPPVIDLSRSSADTPTDDVCTDSARATCTTLAADLAQANRSCATSNAAACTRADAIQRQIITEACIACFPK
jgi:hypothetical protein